MPKDKTGKNRNYAYSLIEILIVIGIFAIFLMIVTQSIVLTLRGSKKSESVVNVKEELEYASNTIERNLASAQKVTCTGNPQEIQYISRYGPQGTFSCLDISGADPRIASSSGATTYRLTSNKISITACNFTCTTESGGTSIVFNISGNARGLKSVEGATYSTSKKVFLEFSERK
jgi:prepilin-type N-terminal cleavage/methylation domain-containing protein